MGSIFIFENSFLITKVRCANRLSEYHRQLYQRMETMVVQPPKREAVSVHGEGQCVLPHHILPFDTVWRRTRLDNAAPLVHNRLVADFFFNIIFMQADSDYASLQSTLITKVASSPRVITVVYSVRQRKRLVFRYLYGGTISCRHDPKLKTRCFLGRNV